MTPEEIRVRRVEAGMSKEALAAALGISLRTIYRWEQGEVSPKKGDEIAMDVVFAEQERPKAPAAPRRKSNNR